MKIYVIGSKIVDLTKPDLKFPILRIHGTQQEVLEYVIKLLEGLGCKIVGPCICCGGLCYIIFANCPDRLAYGWIITPKPLEYTVDYVELEIHPDLFEVLKELLPIKYLN